MGDSRYASSHVVDKWIRGLRWLMIGVAWAPISGFLLAGLIELMCFPSMVSTGGASGSDWGGGGGFAGLACLTLLHVPYTLLLILTARGLSQRRHWARILTLSLTPFMFVLMLFSFGGIATSLHQVLHWQNSEKFVDVVIFIPLFLTTAIFWPLAHVLLWKAEVREAFRRHIPDASERAIR